MDQAQRATPNENETFQRLGRGIPAYLPYPVNIIRVANGFTIQVGCKTFVAKTWLEASTGLAEYWQDPLQAERKYSTFPALSDSVLRQGR